MKTNKEMQLKILNKMIENIENGDDLLKDIQYRNIVNLKWDDQVYDIGSNHFKSLEMRVKPETIKVNGVEIPKPVKHDEVLLKNTYYFPQCHERMYGELTGISIKEYNVWFTYETKEEAIEASKLLFGLG